MVYYCFIISIKYNNRKLVFITFQQYMCVIIHIHICTQHDMYNQYTQYYNTLLYTQTTIIPLYKYKNNSHDSIINNGKSLYIL